MDRLRLTSMEDGVVFLKKAGIYTDIGKYGP